MNHVNDIGSYFLLQQLEFLIWNSSTATIDGVPAGGWVLSESEQLYGVEVIDLAWERFGYLSSVSAQATLATATHLALPHCVTWCGLWGGGGGGGNNIGGAVHPMDAHEASHHVKFLSSANT